MISFYYTKESGAISPRVLVPIKTPFPDYFGVDISELDTEDQVAFEERVKVLREEFKVGMDDLMKEYDIKHNYRHFKSERMGEITVIE